MKDKNLFIVGDAKAYPTLAAAGLLGENINVRLIRAHWNEILRLAASIKQGTVTASLMLRKLEAIHARTGWLPSPCENWPTERTLFALNWIQELFHDLGRLQRKRAVRLSIARVVNLEKILPVINQ
ncbi:MAG: Tn3 family transposase [Vulcanimicrobiota bacterium]